MAYDSGWLKEKQRRVREEFPINLGLRVHRAISWIKKAEIETDPDGQFIFLWIAFNACYAEYSQKSHDRPERSRLNEFFRKINGLDSDGLIYRAIWQQYSQAIRTILNNQFVFEPFWSYYNQISGHDNWAIEFEKAKKKSLLALRDRKTARVLYIVFDRLYVLRNQLVHGGATYDGGVNRAQVKDGAAILGHLVPLFVNIMMDHPESVWGKPFYPVTDSDPTPSLKSNLGSSNHK